MPATSLKTGLRLAGATGLAALIAFMFCIHNFLAITKPVSGQVLIVESWFANRPTAMREVAGHFAKGHYQLVLFVGGTKSGPAGKSSAELAADCLAGLGLDRKFIQVAAETDVEFNRTFGSARTARSWITRERPEVRAVDVVTLGVHARKSLILFQKVFAPERTVGIIALTETAYPPNQWWTTRTGWYLVLRNTAGYFQALLQSPDPAASN